MDITTLTETPPWEWPEDAADHLMAALRNEDLDESQRLLAAELAGEVSVINDGLAETLLAIGMAPKAPELLRLRALYSLGPAIEYGDIEGFEEPDEVPISEKTFHGLLRGLHDVYRDTGLSDALRRSALETSFHAPQDWHPETIRQAFMSDDDAWKLTAVFCMGFVHGFKDQILEALGSQDEDIHHEAVIAAGNWELDEAWNHIAGLVTGRETDKYLLLAAMEAVAAIRPHEAVEILTPHLDSEDEDIADMAQEAISMAQGQMDEDETEMNEDDSLFPK
jgi:hypothetical protein